MRFACCCLQSNGNTPEAHLELRIASPQGSTSLPSSRHSSSYHRGCSLPSQVSNIQARHAAEKLFLNFTVPVNSRSSHSSLGATMSRTCARRSLKTKFGQLSIRPPSDHLAGDTHRSRLEHRLSRSSLLIRCGQLSNLLVILPWRRNLT